MKQPLRSRHIATLNRQRRLVLQEDANMPFEAFRLPFEQWLDFRFRGIDTPGSQIDGVWWDIGLAEDTYACYNSRILPRLQLEGFDDWCAQGIDWPAELVKACHSRGLEAFWNNRVCPVDFAQPMSTDLHLPHDHPRRQNPLKNEHPDWTVKCWWPHGLWNLAVPEVRERKVAILRELLERYRLDGIQLDFARHTPCLPPGQEWENRDHVTTFVTMVRQMMLDVERISGHPRLLAARVGETIDGNHRDGFEVERWAREGLLDIFTLGGRTTTLDVAGFKEITRNTPAHIVAAFDGHHTTDGYYSPGMDYYRAVFRNFHRQGVDAISLFNWTCAPPETYDEFGLPGMMKREGSTEATSCAGDLATLPGNRLYAVERRSGYPWAGNYVYRNDDRPLPCPLPCNVPMWIHEELATDEGASSVTLRIVLDKADPDILLTAELNGHPLAETARDPDWEDSQIYGENPQPSSGAHAVYEKGFPNVNLLLVEFDVEPTWCVIGANQIGLSGDPENADAMVEKVELTVRYGEYEPATCAT